MRIHDLEDLDLRDQPPVQPAVRPCRDRIMGRYEQQTVRMFEIDGQLAATVPGQGMTTGRGQVADVRQGSGGLKFHHPLHQFARSFCPEEFDRLALLRTDFLESLCFEEYTHILRSSQVLVNTLC